MKKPNGNAKRKPAKVLTPAGWDDLEVVRSGIDLAGFYTPRDIGPDGQDIYGTLVKYVERRSPTPSQAAGFVILILAAQVPGLVFDDKEDGGSEGMLNAGDAIGVDIRTSYSMLKDPAHEGKRVHLYFKGKKTLGDGRTFWDVDVSLQRPVGASAAEKGDDIPF